MAARSPTRHPEGLGLHWSHVWDTAFRRKQADGTWSIGQSPLLDEYVFALRAADDAREAGEDVKWDRHAKRAAALADQLVLTPAARRRLGVGAKGKDPFDGFASLDELAPRRKSRRGR